MELAADFSLEVNLGRFIDNILTGNNSDILLCVLITSNFVGAIFKSKSLYSYSRIGSIECTLSDSMENIIHCLNHVLTQKHKKFEA